MALGAHDGNDAVGQLHGTEHVGFELLAQHRARQVFHGSGLAVGAVVEKCIECAAGAGKNFVQRPPDGIRVGQVELHAFQTLGLQSSHIGIAAGRREHAPASRRQSLRHA